MVSGDVPDVVTAELVSRDFLTMPSRIRPCHVEGEINGLEDRLLLISQYVRCKSWSRNSRAELWYEDFRIPKPRFAKLWQTS
jgi:hypothetical protein